MAFDIIFTFLKQATNKHKKTMAEPFFDKLAKAMAVTFFEWIFLCTYMIAWLVSKNDV